MLWSPLFRQASSTFLISHCSCLVHEETKANTGELLSSKVVIENVCTFVRIAVVYWAPALVEMGYGKMVLFIE